jgi:adenine-specific DNA-methyltransferase
VWNRFKPQLRDKPGRESVYPLIWAECVSADGRFVFRAQKRNHSPYFQLGPDDGWLLVGDPCILVQRTTAKEQVRRLIAAELPSGFVKRHGGVVVENHLNMIRAIRATEVPPAVVAALLNSSTLDEVFRCMNGSVAVSAFELEALPLPNVKQLTALKRLVRNGADRARIDAECTRLYAGPRP